VSVPRIVPLHSNPALSGSGGYRSPSIGRKSGKSPSLVLAHETAVADDIGGENGREPAFDPLSTQNSLPKAPYARLACRAIA